MHSAAAISCVIKDNMIWTMGGHHVLNLEWNLQHLAMLIYQKKKKKGVVKTEQLPNPGICTVENSHSYQFYGPTPVHWHNNKF